MGISGSSSPQSSEKDLFLPAYVSLQWAQGLMAGEPVQESFKTLHDLQRVFHDSSALDRMGSDREVYRVRWWAPVNAGTEGGLFWGVTVIQPGKVGQEYFMTHGHFHAKRTRAEFYGTVSGNGMLIEMNAERKTWAKSWCPGACIMSAERMPTALPTPATVRCLYGRAGRAMRDTTTTPSPNEALERAWSNGKASQLLSKGSDRWTPYDSILDSIFNGAMAVSTSSMGMGFLVLLQRCAGSMIFAPVCAIRIVRVPILSME